MKKILLLSALIVAPAWAGDIVVAPAAPQTALHGTSATTGVVIELKGDVGDVVALVADLKKEAAFKEATCVPAKEPSEVTEIACSKADGRLMAFLSTYASSKVHWTISGKTIATALICATGCTLMNCPPPGGPKVCCKRTTTGYKVCI